MKLLEVPPTHVIFDLDGTLLDTEPLYTEATQRIVGRYGKQFDWGLKRRIMGGKAEVGAALVIAELQLPLTVAGFLGERDAILDQLFPNAPAMPGAGALVEALAGKGVALAIATSSSRALCEMKLARHAFAKRFHAIVCSDDPGIARAKPAPDLFLAAAAQLRAEPARCLVVEDTPKGVAAAAAAGMACVAVVDPHMRDQDFGTALAQLGSLEELTLDALGLA